MEKSNKLRETTLKTIGSTETEGLSVLMSNLSCSTEPAMINGFGETAEPASSSRGQQPTFLRASQAPVRSKLRFQVSSNRILVRKQPGAETGMADRWLEDIQEEFTDV